MVIITKNDAKPDFNNCASDKVRRWKLFTQEYDALVKHLPGDQNRIADNFCRLCVLVQCRRTPGQYRHSLQSTTMYPSAVLATLMDPHDCASTAEMLSTITPKETKLLEKHHNEITGHHGVSRIKAQLQGKKPMPHLAEKVRSFIKYCECCQKMNQL